MPETEPRLCCVAGCEKWHIYFERKRISTGEVDRTATERVLADFRKGLNAPQPTAASSVAEMFAAHLPTVAHKPGAERLRRAHKPLTRIIGTIIVQIDIRSLLLQRLRRDAQMSGQWCP